MNTDNYKDFERMNIFEIENLLGSKITGISRKLAKTIVRRFASDTLEVLDKESDRLLEIDGIGKKKLEIIKSGWTEQKELRNIVFLFRKYLIEEQLAEQIFTRYKCDTERKIQENPYLLYDWGLDFTTADNFARKEFNISEDFYGRVRCGILHSMNLLVGEGHVFAYQNQLLNTAMGILHVRYGLILQEIQQMISDKELISERTDNNLALYFPELYEAEVYSSNKLHEILRSEPLDILIRKKKGDRYLEVDIQKLQKKLQITYNEQQIEAIRKSVSSKILLLTGAPGTGKTTTIRGMLEVFHAAGIYPLLAAPTGRAARRMQESIEDVEVNTIHKLLEFNSTDGFQKNNDNLLNGGVLIIDEASMIDIQLMGALLKAVSVGIRLIFVGDKNQLPSVKAGRTFEDMIDSGVFQTVHLTEILRQAKDSLIVQNAHHMINEEPLVFSNTNHSDFEYIACENKEKIKKEIISLMKVEFPLRFNSVPLEIQVLAPILNGPMGVKELNSLLQEALNPEEKGICLENCIFRKKDKVMQIKNNYIKDVFNGDIGIIDAVNCSEKSLVVDFDKRKVTYYYSELEELTLAYAITIHKAQGSEFPYVIIPIAKEYDFMLQRNLVYTAMTRAQKLLVTIGDKNILTNALQKKSNGERNSLLQKRLRGDVF